jgi:Domain of unknown function (DUF4166)
MATIRHSPPGLYPQLLGSRWNELDESVQCLHGQGNLVRATGTFRVCHGNNRLLRLLARLARLPAAGESVDLQLVVTPVNQGEEWRRTFAGSLMVSTQWQQSHGLLAERMGPLQMRFQLNVVGGALYYETQSVALCLGPLRVPLPSWLAPRVTAWERPGGDRERIQVAVEASLPGLGLLIAYEGTVTRAEAQA